MDVKAQSGGKAGGVVAQGIKLSERDRTRLLDLARALGCTAQRGSAANEPSIAVMLRQIAAGDLAVVRVMDSGAGRTATDRIMELRRSQPGLTAPQVAALVGCAESTVRAAWGGHRGKGARGGAGS